MAIFGGTKKDTDSTQSGGNADKQQHAPVEDVIREPRITEKAALGTERSMYVFNVAPDATKSQITKAITRMYKVTPRKVNTARIPKKTVRRRGILGEQGGGKKAYVYLKEGEKIELM
jgi:large subunit ribosomal protein L23